MNKFAAIFTAAAALCLHAAPSHAQSRTWVSGVGNDANPCSRTAPCKTYAGAISKTAAGGEINCLDPGGFGALTITKSISVVCDYTEGGVLASSTTGFLISMSASGNIVTLKGQDVECFINGLHGVRIIGGFSVTVHVHKTQLRNCRGGGSGITVANTAGTVELYVKDTYITGNGTTSTTGGIVAAPTGTGSVVLDIDKVRIEDNSAGIRIDTAATTGTIKGTVRDSTVAGSTNNGITANSAGTIATLILDTVAVTGNSFGLVAGGNANGALLTGNTTVTANGTGVFPVAPGQVLTYGDNRVNNNTADGAFTNAGVPTPKK